jgi:hypothetical protein
LDFNRAFEVASAGRRGVGSEILHFAREVANPRISEESIGGGSIHVGPMRRDSEQTPHLSLAEYVEFTRRNSQPAISQAPLRQRSDEGPVFTNPWKPESSGAAQERALRSAATEETNTAWQPGAAESLSDSPVEPGSDFGEDQGQEIEVGDRIEPDPERLSPAAIAARAKRAERQREQEQLHQAMELPPGARIG